MRQATLTTDTVELLHQALDAIDIGQSVQAMHLLKHLLLLKPGSAEAHYLLGAEQAKTGMPARAIASYRTALALDPQLDAARLRLGMLLAAAGQVAEARTIWQPLNTQHPDDPFYQFKTGLLLIAEGQQEPGIVHLQRGMALNHINALLNADMAQVIDDVRSRQRTEFMRQSMACSVPA